jgi:hypothetical protein
MERMERTYRGAVLIAVVSGNVKVWQPLVEIQATASRAPRFRMPIDTNRHRMGNQHVVREWSWLTARQLQVAPLQHQG